MNENEAAIFLLCIVALGIVRVIDVQYRNALALPAIYLHSSPTV